MALRFLKKTFFHRNKRNSQIQINNRIPIAVENDYSEFHMYGTINDGDYGIIDDRPTTSTHWVPQSLTFDLLDDFTMLSLLQRLPAADVSRIRLVNKRCNRLVKDNEALLEYRQIDYISINHRRDGVVKVVVITDKGHKTEHNCQLMHLHLYLSRLTISRLDLTGKVCDIFLDAFPNVHVGMVCFKQARVVASSNAFSVFLRLHQVQSLVVSQCKFTDDSLISDDLFANNPQITNIKINGTDGHWQRFPLLSDRTLAAFSRRGLPNHFALNYVESSISIHGVIGMIKTVRSLEERQARYQWTFGRILSTTSTCIQALCVVRNIVLLQIQNTQLVVMTDDDPEVRAYVFTKNEDDREIQTLDS